MLLWFWIKGDGNLMAQSTMTIKNIDEFNREVDKVLVNVKAGMEKQVLTKIAMDTHRNLQKRTPRQYGRARAGWNSTVDTIPSEWKPVKGLKHYSLTPFSGVNQIKYSSLINLSNNVEYIVPLDEGHSVQASNIVSYVLNRVGAHLAQLVRKESKRKIK